MASTNLFRGLSKAAREEVLGFFTPRDYEPNDLIVAMGENGIEMFYIHKGRATVKVDKGVVAELGPGDTFGEVCLADGGVRSASVFAIERVKAYALDAKSLDALADSRPLYAAILLLNVLRLVGEKLRNADAVIEKHLSKERAQQIADQKSIFKKILARVS
ncbi:MAG: cyclic nucleotide-binding domain-containing protein [Deltaproteobacteria bacterium]|nr:cyclic nucleotide-binding domain-containing protein [Deltaproteobacteria bacterium]